MRPPVGAVITPALRTVPALPAEVNVSRPARKSASLTLSVLAMKPPTSMRAPGPTMMPAGLMSHSEPLAFTWPWICEGSPPVTRASSAAAAPGCRISTNPAEPTLKVEKLISAWPDV